ncbi:hypothetical protein GJU40_11310 [Bacillus lacus]|uniref:STAS domain-containing protein n=1 Tax=Metabacillus lacus TaxID=1983721 RepID=A0A7X2IZM4_9BACI|nr:STAS domain-containing protein [Metabacillus lacus]MRX72737.1 hypothetical protein [Metabacillus lacus]
MNQTNEQLSQRITELEERIRELETIIEHSSVPIIPSIIPNTVLIPLTGELSPSRFEQIIPRILEGGKIKDVDSAVIDLSAITTKEIENLNIAGHYFRNLIVSLNLLGIQVFFVGFTPALAKELVQTGLPLANELTAFSSFKAALTFLMKKKGLAFSTI